MSKEKDIGFLIHTIDKNLKNDVDTQLRKHDLTFSQSQVLNHLNESGGCLSQKKLQEILNVTHPTIVGLIKRLQINGFVSTEYDEKDKRNKIVHITDKAVSFHQDMKKAKYESYEKMLKDISDKDRKVLADLLSKVADNISSEGICK